MGGAFLSRILLLHVGAILILGSLMFGILSYYYIKTVWTENELRHYIFDRQFRVIYPLRNYHFLSYTFLFSGLVALAYLLLTSGCKIRITREAK